MVKIMRIYAVKITDIDTEEINELCTLLEQEKKSQIERFKNKKDKLRALTAAILTRIIIAERLEPGNINIEFGKNQYGKPYLKGNSALYFNVAHSGDYVVGAFDEEPVGIDIEEIKDIDYEDIVKGFFTEGELHYIIDKDVPKSLIRFYEMWTLKESYIKFCGQGFSIDMQSFELNIDKHKIIKLFIAGRPQEHAFKTFKIGPSYKAAVCSLNKNIPDYVTMLEQNTLINKYLKLCVEQETNIKWGNQK